MDKIYLSKEVENLLHQIRKLEDQSERQQQKLRDVKKSREDLFQKLIKYKEEQKTTYPIMNSLVSSFLFQVSCFIYFFSIPLLILLFNFDVTYI